MEDENLLDENSTPEDSLEHIEEPFVENPATSTLDIYGQRKAKDQELYDTWKKTGHPSDLTALVNQLSPLIHKEVQRASGSMPKAALLSSGKRWAIQAIETYDPTKGAGLSTHVTSYLRKVRRVNYKYQNAVQLPEGVHLQYAPFKLAKDSLTEELSREPTDEEIAGKLGWSKPQVVKFKKSLYDDLIESSSEKPSEFIQFNENTLLLEYLMQTLTPEEKYIFETAKTKPAKEVADHLGINISRYNYLKSKLIKKIQDIQHQLTP